MGDCGGHPWPPFFYFVLFILCFITLRSLLIFLRKSVSMSYALSRLFIALSALLAVVALNKWYRIMRSA